jgi:ABC-2 type transport system permease protein
VSAISLHRISALALRYLYLLRGSWIRTIELAYWPTVQMILWGFITQYLAGHSDVLNQAAGLLLSGVLLWDVLFRSQLGLSVVFFEELHSAQSGAVIHQPIATARTDSSADGWSVWRAP